MLTCTKTYIDFPFGHRAPLHDGHCHLIHGHNWSFELTFVGAVDENGFVVDFGKLKELRDVFGKFFDHTLLLNVGDPLRQDLERFFAHHQINNVVVVEDCSCEGIAKLVYTLANPIVTRLTDGRARVRQVTVYEDSKNSATYVPVAVQP